MKILITGCAGFIGFNLSNLILKKKVDRIVGIDNINNYYDIKLKKDRLKILNSFKKNYKFYKLDIKNFKKLKENFKKERYDYVIHLAAQAGVRHSIKNPRDYFDSNLLGFFNVLECCRLYKIKHFIFASTSSTYGNVKKFPTKEESSTDKPLSFYAATKKSNEVMAYSYSNIYSLPCTGLRFFTVYGPYGRPDMALYKFTKSIYDKKKFYLFNNGNHTRDFTYIDDVINIIFKVLNKPSKQEIPYNIYNVANSDPQPVKNYLKIVEKITKRKADIKLMPLQKGDVVKTHANSKKIRDKIGKIKKTSLANGIEKFIKWYKEYFKL